MSKEVYLAHDSGDWRIPIAWHPSEGPLNVSQHGRKGISSMQKGDLVL
jgi:hypothetical protein